MTRDPRARLVPHNDPKVLEYPHEYLKKLSDEELAVNAKRLRAMLTSALPVE